ncbi:MAG TPA: phage minor capsid protein [Ruminococcus sp.]
MTLQQAIDIAVKDFLDKGINCIVYRNGRHVNISDYIRMALRATSTIELLRQVVSAAFDSHSRRTFSSELSAYYCFVY